MGRVGFENRSKITAESFPSGYTVCSRHLQTLKSSRSLCSLDYEDTGDPETDPRSSPSARNMAADPATPGASPAADHLFLDRHHPPHLRRTAALSESDEDTSDAEHTEVATFPLECGDLDLEEIENN